MKDRTPPTKKVSKLSKIVFYGIIFLSQCFLSSSCSDKGTSKAIKVNITCDSYLELYVDGKYLGGDDTNIKNRGFFVYELMAESHVIALSCKASPPPWEGGILASFDNGLVTDPSWKCITSATFGWNTRNYQDHDWPMATSHGPNNDSTWPWGEISSIDKKAVWIWSKDNKNDTEIYCRRNLVEPCTKVKPSFFQTMESDKDLAIKRFLLLHTKVASATECGLRCGQHSACAPFAVENSDGPGSKLCELNAVTAKSHPQSVVRKEGFQYYEASQVFY